MRKTVAWVVFFLLILPMDGHAEERGDTSGAGTPADAARMALAAAEAQNVDAIPRLIADLERFGGSEEPQHGDLALLAVLDALIRLEARPPAEALLPLLRWKKPYLHALTVLAVRTGDAAVLLPLFDHAGGGATVDRTWWMNDFAWAAAGNANALLRVPGFAEHLLGSLRMTLSVVVRDTELPEQAARRRGSDYTTRTKLHIPAGFPSLPVYRLTRDEGTELVEGAGGAIRFRRRLVPPGDHEFETRTGWCRWELTKAGWLRALAGMDSCALDPSLRVVLPWSTPEDFLEEATQARTKLIRQYWACAEALLDQGLLAPPACRWLGPFLVTQVQDQREDLHGHFLPSLPAPLVACPLGVGGGGGAGTAPSAVTDALSASTSASVRLGPVDPDTLRQVDAAWVARFREAVGPLTAERFIPLKPSGNGMYVVELAGGAQDPGTPKVTARIDFHMGCIVFELDDEPHTGAWTIAERRSEVLAALTSLFPPTKGSSPVYGKPSPREQALLTHAKKGTVYAYAGGRRREVDASWLERFRAALGEISVERYYSNLPDGLFVRDYDVVLSSEDGEEVGVTLSLDASYLSIRYSDMGHPGYWTFLSARPEVLKLLQEVFPEERRSW